jgi:hypothetical protein
MVFHCGERNLEITSVRWIHVDLNQCMPEELQRDISISSGLGFEHGDPGWRTLGEQSVVQTSNEGFDNLRRMKILRSHP